MDIIGELCAKSARKYGCNNFASTFYPQIPSLRLLGTCKIDNPKAGLCIKTVLENVAETLAQRVAPFSS